ncbi:MAG: ZIP family metal transporter [Chloroflexota bacterium]
MIAILYTLVTSAATVVGGLLPYHPTIRRIELRYLIAFSSGLMISIVFFEMLPELNWRGATTNVVALALGFFVVYVLEKMVMIHACGEEECDEHIHSLGWPAMIGVGIESLIDGAAIVASYSVAPGLGLAVAAAVFAHELPRGFATTVVMKNAGYGRRGVAVALAIDAGFAPLGALAASFLGTPGILPNLLAFAAGTFLYIGAGDLLPEAHKKFNMRVVAMVIAGALIVPLAESVLGV